MKLIPLRNNNEIQKIVELVTWKEELRYFFFKDKEGKEFGKHKVCMENGCHALTHTIL